MCGMAWPPGICLEAALRPPVVRMASKASLVSVCVLSGVELNT